MIELMIVMVVISILATIAYPSFMSQVRKSRRADAVDAAARIQQAQERWRANNTTYTSTIGTGGLGLATTSSGGRYTLAVSGPSGTGYVLTATGTGSQAADTGCTVLTVTVTNGNGAYTPPACWSR